MVGMNIIHHYDYYKIGNLSANAISLNTESILPLDLKKYQVLFVPTCQAPSWTHETAMLIEKLCKHHTSPQGQKLIDLVNASRVLSPSQAEGEMLWS